MCFCTVLLCYGINCDCVSGVRGVNSSIDFAARLLDLLPFVFAMSASFCRLLCCAWLNECDVCVLHRRWSQATRALA